MNIDVVRIHFKDNYGDDKYSYKYLPFQYCCDNLKNFEHIEFNDEYDCRNPNDYCDECDNTIPGFSVCVEEPVPWEDMGNLCYYRIGYCPFCGQKININIARKEDRSADYSTMSTLRGLLKERIKSTDSKKESDSLDKEIKELDRKINEMWNFGEYKSEE